MVEAPIVVQEDVWGLQTLQRTTNLPQMARAGYIFQESALVRREKRRWGAEREKAHVRLLTPIVEPNFQHRPRKGKLKAKHEGDDDDRGVIA
jgi:hypothetical protein